MTTRPWREWLDEQLSMKGIKANYFLVGDNPDGSGGGLIAMAETSFKAADLRSSAMYLGFKNTRILNSDEYWNAK